MSTALTIQKTIVPPPTKTEVIEALVQLRFQEWDKKNKEAKAEIEKLEKAIQKEAFALAKKQSFDQAAIRISTYSQVRVEVEFTLYPAALKADFARWKKLRESLSFFDEKEERKRVMESIGSLKPKRDLLADPEARKKLIALGTEIGVI